MANKRIKDLPNIAAPIAADRFPLDGTITGSAPIGPVIAAMLNGDEADARAELGLGDAAVLDVASEAEAVAGTSNAKLMTPARVRDAVEQSEFTYEDMANPETLDAIINRTGRTPFMDGATAGASSHHAVINATIDKVITGGGGIVWLPPIAGEWKIGGPINLHKTGYAGSYLKLQGVGEKVRMTRLNATGDTFVVGDGTNPVYYVAMRNILLNAAVPRVSGVDLKLTKASQMTFEDLVFDGCYSAFQGTDLNTIYVTRAVFNLPNQTTGYGAVVRSDPSGSGRTDIVKFAEVTVQAYNGGSYGLLVDGRVAGVHTDGFYALGTQIGLHLTSSASVIADIPTFCDFRKFETDRALNVSAYLEKAYRTEFHRSDLSNTSGAMDTPYPQGGADNCAMLLAAGAIDTKFFAGRIGNCQQQAVQDNSSGAQFFGTTFNDMSKVGAGTAAAVYLGTTARGFNYQGCRVEGFSRASYAFQIESAAKNGIIRDTIYKDLVTGFSSGTGTNVTIAGQVNDT